MRSAKFDRLNSDQFDQDFSGNDAPPSRPHCNREVAMHTQPASVSRPKAQTATPVEIDPRRLLTVEEVGKQLRVSRYTIWRLARDGKFPAAVAIGSRRRW